MPVYSQEIPVAVPTTSYLGPAPTTQSSPSWRNAVVKVQTNRSGGSGVLVWSEKTRGTVLTNYHVVAGSSKIAVYWERGGGSRARVIWSDKNADVAALLVDPPDDGPVIPLASPDELPKSGDVVQVAGYGSTRQFTAWNTTVAGYTEVGKLRDAGDYGLVVNSNAARGDSGGPIIFNDKVVAILWGFRGNSRRLMGASSEYIQLQCNGPFCRRPQITGTKTPYTIRPPTGVVERPIVSNSLAKQVGSLEKTVSDLGSTVTSNAKSISENSKRLEVLERELAGLGVKLDALKIDTDKLADTLADKLISAHITTLVDAVQPHIKLPTPRLEKSEEHMVVVFSQNASYAARMNGFVEDAQEAYTPLLIADPPKWGYTGTLPVLLAYKDRDVVQTWEGVYDVENALTAVSRNQLHFE